MIELTVFTPAYNRAYILENLYRSLGKQTDRRFEWVVVDDGSTDSTAKLMADFKEKAGFEFTYVKWGSKSKLFVSVGVVLALLRKKK